jgi:DtxR family Mn-dependent transcriptional regulator
MSAGHFQEFEDEYLETMYEFYEREPEERVRTGLLAKSLKISPASATEMVQRLASKGFLDYVPYKGSKLTPKGLEHGKMMKRRHRLAEVLLEHLPFEGNHHETACRLEHAIDDDLDVALSVYLGNPTLDPSGRDIPEIKSELSSRLDKSSANLCELSNLEEGQKGSVSIISLSLEDMDVLDKIGIKLGTEISNDGEYNIVESGKIIQVNKSLAENIILVLG